MGDDTDKTQQAEAQAPAKEDVKPQNAVADPPKDVAKKGKKKDKAADEVKPETPQAPVEDRSAYNCPDCKGEGLTNPPLSPAGEICKTCKGTGKV